MNIKMLHLEKYIFAFEIKYMYSELIIYKDCKYINFILKSLIAHSKTIYLQGF